MGTNYFHSLYVDNDKKYYLSWKFDEKDIVFEVIVNTTGYIAFGFSPDGTMEKADILIGKVNNAQPYLEDYYGFGNGTLKKDSSNDWILLSSVAADNQRKLTIQRQLVTDDANDFNITCDTVRVIWAYGEKEFNANNFTVGGYKSLRLLQIERPDFAHPANARKLLIAMNETLIPNKTTTYLCKDFELPKYNQKMHIVKISPIVTKGNELIVHHMLLYSCKKKNLKRTIEEVRLCYDENMPEIWEKCPMVVFGWAIGGSSFPLPEHVGIPLEVTTDPVTFLLEIHYDNPKRKSGVIDSSGFEMILIPARRKFDGAIIEIGQIPFDPLFRFTQMIPPYQPDFKSNSICLSSCIYDVYPPTTSEIIIMKIFAVLLHAHLLGRQIILHHFRNGKELPNIAADRNYDFNYQEMVFLKKEVEVLRGDDLKVECTYNSMARSKFTWGGLSTSDEMCLAYVMYYPKMRTTNCLSAIGVVDTKWREYSLNTSNLLQFKDQEIAKKFEQTVNGLGNNSSLLTYCSDGINTAVRQQPTSNFHRILQYETSKMTESTSSKPDVTSKAGFTISTHSYIRLHDLILVELLCWCIH